MNRFKEFLMEQDQDFEILNSLNDFLENFDEVTAKMEGQSFTVVPTFKGDKLTGAYVCSRNNAYKLEDKSLFWDMMRKYDVINKMKKIYKETGKAYILQGEQVGPTIQQNIYDFKENQWYLFTVKDYSTLKQLSYEEQVKVADKFDMKVVPLLWTGKLKDVMPDVDAAVAFVERASWNPIEGDRIHSWVNLKNKGNLWTDYMQHEGVVVRT